MTKRTARAAAVLPCRPPTSQLPALALPPLNCPVDAARLAASPRQPQRCPLRSQLPPSGPLPGPERLPRLYYGVGAGCNSGCWPQRRLGAAGRAGRLRHLCQHRRRWVCSVCVAHPHAGPLPVDSLYLCLHGGVLRRCGSLAAGEDGEEEEEEGVGWYHRCRSPGSKQWLPLLRLPAAASHRCPLHPTRLPESRGPLWLAAAAGVGIGVPFNLLLMSPPAAMEVATPGARLEPYGLPPV